MESDAELLIFCVCAGPGGCMHDDFTEQARVSQKWFFPPKLPNFFLCVPVRPVMIEL